VFPSYYAAVTGHADTFDSIADWQQWGFWDQAPRMAHDVAVRIDCGNEDVLSSTTRALLERVPGATGHIGSGCHSNDFWRPNATAELTFLAARLAA
jgi:hypothetical protein